jgi:hypothetical protein
MVAATQGQVRPFQVFVASYSAATGAGFIKQAQLALSGRGTDSQEWQARRHFFAWQQSTQAHEQQNLTGGTIAQWIN